MLLFASSDTYGLAVSVDRSSTHSKRVNHVAQLQDHVQSPRDN